MCKSPFLQVSLITNYTYDDNANRLYKEINTTIGTYNQEDQLKSYGTTEYSYSTDGYLQTKTTPTRTTTYTYSIFGELQTITLEDNTLIEYKHNANHQRVAKLINGEIVKKYLWLNLTTLLATYDKDDNLITRYEYTSDRVPETMTHNKEIYHLLYNHQGSLRAVVDQEGTLIKELHYDSFGTITLDTNPDFEVEFGFSGGDTNLYGYVLGDPVNLVDPEGLQHTTGAFIPYNSSYNCRDCEPMSYAMCCGVGGYGLGRYGYQWAARNPMAVQNFMQGATTQTPNLSIPAQRYGYAAKKMLDNLMQ